MKSREFSVVQLAYGGMGPHVFNALTADPRFNLKAIVTPTAESRIYRSAAILPHEKKAKEMDIEIIKTEDLDELHLSLERIKPDVVVIASFLKIIPQDTLKLSRYVNVHHGNLPRQRGRANINWAIINGEPSVTVSVHEAVPELDAGKIIKQFHFPILPDENVENIYQKINSSLRHSLADVCFDYLSDKTSLQDQNHSHATYYITRLPQDGLIDWSLPRVELLNLIRAITRPFPGAYTYFKEKKMVIWNASLPNEERFFEGIIPGRVAAHKRGVGVEVLAGDGPILLTEIEYEDFVGDPAEIVRSSKDTLGLQAEALLKRIEDLEARMANLVD